MVKHLNLKKGLFTALVVGCTVGTGCAKVSADDPIYFSGVENASVKKYYDIYADQKEYFIDKNRLSLAIPSYDETCSVGLRVDDEGNTIAIEASEIEDGDCVIDCYKTILEDTRDLGIYMSGVDSVEVVTGYRIEDNDGLKYDLVKSDVVDFLNDEGMSLVANRGTLGFGKKIYFKSNPNGGPDSIYSGKKK